MFFKNILNTFLVYLAIMCMIKLTLSQSCAGRYSPSYKGTCSKRTECTGALLNNLCSGDLVCCISEPNPVSNNFVTSNDLEKLTGLKNNRISSISRVLQSPTTNPTCSQKASFLSQLAHESANFMYGEELGNGTEVYFDKYENRIDLGNTEPGDGRKFRGRGFIQITGRANYARAGKDLSLDLVNDPEMAAFPSVAAKIAVWFWQNGAYVDLNTLADNTFYSYSIMTSKINGGLKRLKERTELLEKAIDLYKCSSLLKGKGETCSINQEQAECKPMCVKGLEGKPYCGCNGKTQAGLCKGPTNIKCCLEKCGNYMDLTFVLDSSGSINSGDFTKAKSFIRSIVSSLDIGATQTRVGIINYATSIELVTYLNSIYNKAQLLNKIDSIVQIDTSTYTGEALTKGRANYARAGKDLSLDLVNDPEMAAFPSVAAKIAVWFWQNGAYVDLNTLADNTFYSYSIMTSKINGGLKRLKERTELLEKAIDLYKCSSLLKGKGETCSINQEQAECKPMCVKGLEGKPYCGCNGKTQAGLCKGPTNIKCCLEKCGNYMDLTFVLDSSGSINSGDFTKAKSFIRSIVSSLDIGATQTRVGIINYATSIELVTYLNSIYNKAQLLNKIDSIVQIDTSTYTGEALTKCKDIYSTQNGMRDSSEGVSKLIVVLTDGESNGSIEPGPVAKELQSKGITMISIGVGSSLNFQELIDIASPGRVLLIDDYTNVLNAFEDISQISCSQPAEIPSETAVIKVEKDSFRYFYYPIVYEQGKDVVNIKLNVVEGDADLFGSFTNQQPNDNEVIDEDSMARLANSKSINDLVLDLPTQLQDNVNVYIGVKGKADQNAFKLQVATANKLLNSAKRLSNLNLFFYLMIIFSIYAY